MEVTFNGFENNGNAVFKLSIDPDSADILLDDGEFVDFVMSASSNVVGDVYEASVDEEIDVDNEEDDEEDEDDIDEEEDGDIEIEDEEKMSQF
jgi:hypothetical protein